MIYSMNLSNTNFSELTDSESIKVDGGWWVDIFPPYILPSILPQLWLIGLK